MRPKLLFIVAALLLAAVAGAGDNAGAAPALLTPARWACWVVPGSGMGRQCRWVRRGWRGDGSGSGPGIGPGTGPGPRCWVERIPGSGLGPQTVCR